MWVRVFPRSDTKWQTVGNGETQSLRPGNVRVAGLPKEDAGHGRPADTKATPVIAAFHTAASGMASASARASTVAANIVNLMSAGAPENGRLLASETLSAQRAYKPQRAVTTTLASGGVRTRTVPQTPSTFSLYDPTHPSAGEDGMTAYPNISIEREIVEMKLAAHAYKANARILETTDEMLGALINRRL